MKVLLYGWFGENNYGDELLLKTMIEMLHEYKDIEIYVAGTNPTVIEKNHEHIERAMLSMYFSIKRLVKGIFSNPIEMCKNLFECDILIVPGGGAISDWNKSSTKEMFFLIDFFKSQKKNVYLLGIGAGPFFYQKKDGFFYKKLSYAKVITTRDEFSYTELRKLGLKNVLVSNDIAFNSSLFNREVKYPKSIKRIGIVVAPVCMNTIDIYKEYVEELKSLNNKLRDKYEVSFIPFQYNYDFKLINSITDGGKTGKVLYDKDDIWSIEKFVEQQDLIIGMRYHSLILSIILKKYLIPIIYHPKNYSFCKEFDLLEYSESVGNGENWKKSNIDSDRIINKIKKMEEDKDFLEKNTNILIEKIRKNKEKELVKEIIIGNRDERKNN